MPRHPSIAALSAMLASLALAGCATSSDPTALIPADVRASVIAEDRMAGGSISVDEMLSRARDGKGGQGGGQPDATAAASGNETTGSVAAGGAAITPSPAASPQALAQQMAATSAGGRPPAPADRDPPEPKAFFEITFDSTEDVPSTQAKDALARKIKSARLSAKTEVTILSGPGAGTTAFDQALLANRRARNVRSLLPEGWKASQVYNPDFPPDTVRIVLGPVS